MARLNRLLIVASVLGVAVCTAYMAKKKLPLLSRSVPSAFVEAQSRGSAPEISGCPVFPADNVWNVTIDGVPADKMSDAYISSIGASKPVHPDFGSDPNNGIPYMLLTAGTPAAHVDFEYRDESDLGNYPIPDNAPVENGGKPDGDRHVILVDPRRCILYELFAAERTARSAWKAASGARFDLTSNALRDDGKTSADAAGLPIFPGLVRYDEVKSGAIRHAIRFTVPQTQAAYVWPARHYASKLKSTSYPPLGQRFRLRSDFDESRFSPSNRVIIQAMKHYGVILADNGSSMYISGAPDKRWDDDDLHHLSEIKAKDFTAVDESGLLLLTNSGRVDPVAQH